MLSRCAPASGSQGPTWWIAEARRSWVMGLWAIGTYMGPVRPGTRLAAQTTGYLLLYASFDNKFTVESDHSLNVSVEQAQGLIEHWVETGLCP